MGSLRRSSTIATLLAAAALALGACGGDDEGDGTTAADTPGITTNTDPGTTGTTERDRTTTTDEDRTTTRERGEDGAGRDRRGSNGGGSNGGGGSDGGGSDGGGAGAGGAPQQPAQPGNVRRTARTVCANFLPRQISRDLQRDRRDPEEVARDYSRGFPERQRDDAYEGCLAGLRSR